MQSIETRRARPLIAAIALVVVTLTYLSAQGSAGQAPAPQTGKGDLDRSPQAEAAEAAIATTDFTDRVTAALGSDFAGVWFEPDTAKFHVGVTSATARQRVEEVAADVGLAQTVTETPVDSTWAQLVSAQIRWDRGLADLFDRAEVTTSLVPEQNSLAVQLAATVSPSRRAVLEHKASTAGVEVKIAVAHEPHIGLLSQARCRKFNAKEAYCDPSIVAGTTLDSPKEAEEAEEFEEEEVEIDEELEFEEIEGKKRFKCTTGPAVILKKRAKKENATKTYVLTAGHCINPKKGGGGKGAKWHSLNKDKSKDEEIGPAIEFLDSGTDVGAIEVTTNFWATANNPIPVIPTVASWSTSAESDPIPVIKQITPAVTTKTCISGQISDVSCGEIVAMSVSLAGRTTTYNNLYEVKGPTTKEGDSGSPWSSEKEFKEATPTAYVEGTHVGENLKTKNPVFQSLTTSLAELEKLKNLELELLTESNKVRHAKFKASKYSATVHGTSTSEKFTTEAGSISCEESKFHAVLAAASATLTVTPEYKKCKASFGVEATIAMEGCTYVLHATAKLATDSYLAYMDISCPEGKSIKITAGTCKAEIKAQTELEAVDLNNDSGESPKRDITVRPTVTGIAYTVTQDGLFCPFNGTGAKTDGQYTNGAPVTITGQNPSNPSEKIDIEVADE